MPTSRSDLLYDGPVLEDEVINAVQEDEIEVCIDAGEVCGKHSCDVMAGIWDGIFFDAN